MQILQCNYAMEYQQTDYEEINRSDKYGLQINMRQTNYIVSKTIDEMEVIGTKHVKYLVGR